MRSQTDLPQKRNRNRFVLIFSFLAFCLLTSFVFIVTAPMDGHQEVNETQLCDQNGNNAEGDNPANRLLLNSTVVIYVPSEDSRYEDYGLGTMIGERTIVTAKHVGTYRLGTRPEIPALRINELPISGMITVTYSYLPSKGVTSGTDMMKIELPADASRSLPVATQLASQEVIDLIKAGDWVSVVYLEDVTGRTKVGQFEVVEIYAGQAKLADPCKIINPGDSGGGVFYNSALVGVTNSINFVIARTVVDGKEVEKEQYIGEFWIAFLSPAFR